MLNKVNYNKQVFEIKKKKVFERDMELKCFVIYATLIKRDEVDRALQSYEARNRTDYQYILFQYASLNNKLTALHINNVNNMETKYEYLDGAHIEDIIEYDGKVGALRDVLLDIKIRSVPLFIGTKQGIGRKEKTVF